MIHNDHYIYMCVCKQNDQSAIDLLTVRASNKNTVFGKGGEKFNNQLESVLNYGFSISN